MIYKTLIFFVTLLIFEGELFAEEKARLIKLSDITGKKYDLKDLLKKGPVLVDFWATWCKPCKEYFPHLERMHKKYEREGLSIIGINEDGPRNKRKIRPFLHSLNISFPILIDETAEVMSDYGVYSLPTWFLIGKDGYIVRIHRGYIKGDENLLENEIKSLLFKSGDSKR